MCVCKRGGGGPEATWKSRAWPASQAAVAAAAALGSLQNE